MYFIFFICSTFIKHEEYHYQINQFFLMEQLEQGVAVLN